MLGLLFTLLALALALVSNRCWRRFFCGYGAQSVLEVELLWGQLDRREKELNMSKIGARSVPACASNCDTYNCDGYRKLIRLKTR